LARQKELAIRMALGAGWRHLGRQLLTEGLLLSLPGAIAGLLLVWWGVGLLATMIPRGLIPRTEEINFDWRVLVFSFGAAIVTGVLFGLIREIKLGRVDANNWIKESAGRGTAPRPRLRSALVIMEMALSLVLLVGAALLIRTFANLQQVEPGFDSRNILTFQMTLSGK